MRRSWPQMATLIPCRASQAYTKRSHIPFATCPAFKDLFLHLPRHVDYPQQYRGVEDRARYYPDPVCYENPDRTVFHPEIHSILGCEHYGSYDPGKGLPVRSLPQTTNFWMIPPLPCGRIKDWSSSPVVRPRGFAISQNTQKWYVKRTVL